MWREDALTEDKPQCARRLQNVACSTIASKLDTAMKHKELNTTEGKDHSREKRQVSMTRALLAKSVGFVGIVAKDIRMIQEQKKVCNERRGGLEKGRPPRPKRKKVLWDCLEDMAHNGPQGPPGPKGERGERGKQADQIEKRNNTTNASRGYSYSGQGS
eukprot:Seg985.5 transcript_id=Seg985.5/GoldUCD/mRNA.D3Y31 product="hypothetical protein" protein_id=Seg985.5/GoldUCD/D3Y31